MDFRSSTSPHNGDLETKRNFCKGCTKIEWKLKKADRMIGKKQMSLKINRERERERGGGGDKSIYQSTKK